MQVVPLEAYLEMQVFIREAGDDDIDEIVELFCEGGDNSHNWGPEKWRHYYKNYTEGHAVSLVATVDEVIVGHYGLQPIRISGIPAMLGLHAYVAKNQRGLTIISALMQEIDRRCIIEGVKLICGFANPKFSLIKSTIFKWETVCWLGFQKNYSYEDYALMQSKKFKFEYSDEWYEWRFDSVQESYFSAYVDNSGVEHVQILKSRLLHYDAQDRSLELWSPKSTYPDLSKLEFRQPFSIKIYDFSLIQDGILGSDNWCIDMGDSDTFQYIPAKG